MSQGTRRLAAIMFTYMVGYTALTQSDESAAGTATGSGFFGVLRA
jgi:class 3 adenylate cyclase